MAREPFESLLGSTVELGLIEHLLSLPKLEFNVTELARQAKISRQSVYSVLRKFQRWKITREVGRRGNMTFYVIDLDSPVVQSLYAFNEALLGEMYPELAELAKRSFPEVVGKAEATEELGASTVDLFNVTPAFDLTQPSTDDTQSVLRSRQARESAA